MTKLLCVYILGNEWSGTLYCINHGLLRCARKDESLIFVSRGDSHQIIDFTSRRHRERAKRLRRSSLED